MKSYQPVQGPVAVMGGLGSLSAAGKGLGRVVGLGQAMELPPMAVLGDEGADPGDPLAQLGAVRGSQLAAFLAMNMASSAIGGALVGWVASSDGRGAGTGALFTGGMAGIGQSILFAAAGRGGVATVSALLGVAGLGSSLWLAFTRR
ncbi:MAG: hypothetical protein JSV86_05390 [Gemmatimonadota bacterium]|nr:MAG: hypothetical protein JSV86_05390 [Gemmatimonadota bacterium]